MPRTGRTGHVTDGLAAGHTMKQLVVCVGFQDPG